MLCFRTQPQQLQPKKQNLHSRLEIHLPRTETAPPTTLVLHLQHPLYLALLTQQITMARRHLLYGVLAVTTKLHDRSHHLVKRQWANSCSLLLPRASAHRERRYLETRICKRLLSMLLITKTLICLFYRHTMRGMEIGPPWSTHQWPRHSTLQATHRRLTWSQMLQL
jgi:hypothetical protein